MRYRFTVDQYNRLGTAGILPFAGRTELIEGDIFKTPRISSRRSSVRGNLASSLIRSLTDRQGIVSVHNPLELSESSEPEPDVAVLHWRADYYRSHHPYARDVHLLIEVSDITVEWDHEVKLPLYARAHVPEVWIVDLTRDIVEVYREPVKDAYTDLRTVARGESVSPSAFPSLVFAVNDVLGG
jgi:Uma2 family endonuclease